jgi:hypothetical protein
VRQISEDRTMSHYDISYSNISKDQQDAKALNDIREYLGNAKYKLISEEEV